MLITFSLYVVVKWKNAGGNWYQGVMQLLQRKNKESPRLHNYGTLSLPLGGVANPYYNDSKFKMALITQALNNELT